MSKRIGFVGLGDMGKPMAANIVANAIELTVFDAAGTSERAPQNAHIASSVSQLGNRCETVLLSLPDGNASEMVASELVEQADSAVECIIDFSTIGVKPSREINSLMVNSGVMYIDAPVSGGKSGAIAGKLTIMWAGSVSLLEIQRPLLETMVINLFYVGEEAGQAQSMKLLNNYLSATALAATSDAILFGLNQGLTMEVMLDVLNVSSGQNTAVSDKFPKQVATGKFDAGFKLAHMFKDLSLYCQHARVTGTPEDLSKPLLKRWKKANDVMPSADFTQIYEYIRDESSSRT